MRTDKNTDRQTKRQTDRGTDKQIPDRQFMLTNTDAANMLRRYIQQKWPLDKNENFKTNNFKKSTKPNVQ